MKKKKVRKLSLHRETLVELDRFDSVVGGATLTCTGCPNVCEWSGRATCNTCQLTCTTNLC
ncbi:MAG TPA: hypothetical protein VFE33_09010 [Thermoanaerobaculia bacterium]|nr:hypothetical protein [Thermoanaerobaculia bacterium]